MFSFFGDRYNTIQKKTHQCKNILIYDDLNNLVCFIKEKERRNRKEITMYEDDTEYRPILHLLSERIRDIPPVFSVLDVKRLTKIGSLKQNGYKWYILDNEDNEIAWLKRRTALEMIKDYESGFFPKKYIIEMKKAKKVVAEIQRQFPYFLKKHYVDFTKDNGPLLDRRLGLSACIMHILNRNERVTHMQEKMSVY